MREQKATNEVEDLFEQSKRRSKDQEDMDTSQ